MYIFISTYGPHMAPSPSNVLQVSPGNDPRTLDNSSASPSPDLRPFRYDEDSDPEEADIEDHLDQHGFRHRRRVREGRGHIHPNPAVDPVLDRFIDMLQGFGSARGPRDADIFPPRDDEPHVQQRRIHHTTFRSGLGNGTASVTIFSGPAPPAHGGMPPGGVGRIDPFQA